MDFPLYSFNDEQKSKYDPVIDSINIWFKATGIK